MSAATIVAIDTSEPKLALAIDVGADYALPPGEDAEAQIRSLTGGKGAAVVFDFVGAPITTGFASRVVGTGGEIAIVGVGSGTVDVGFFSTPWDAAARAPYWGSRSELMEVVELARAGKIHVEVEEFPLSDAPAAYQRLRAGTLRGRAVIVPDYAPTEGNPT
ncbi:zinc-binding dehydrogenase [Arthrobacter sp. HLT1-21]